LDGLPHLNNRSVHTLCFLQNPEPDIRDLSEHEIKPLTLDTAAPTHGLSTTNRQVAKLCHDFVQHRSNSFSGGRWCGRPHIGCKVR
jgi:hypothetical protein